MPLYPGDPKDGLNNITINGRKVGVKFKAHSSSPVAAVRIYTINSGAGYAGGTGGAYKYEIYNDNNGVPGALIASAVHLSGGPPGTNPPGTPALPPAVPAQRVQLLNDNNGVPGAVFFNGWMGASASNPAPATAPASAAGVILDDKQYTEWVSADQQGGFPLIGFPTFPLLVKGSWYHFVITNVDPNPTVNFISLDAMLAKGPTPGVYGKNPDPDHFVEYSDTTGKVWTIYQTMIAEPFGIFYANGDKQGNSGYQIASDGSTQVGTSYGFGGL